MLTPVAHAPLCNCGVECRGENGYFFFSIWFYFMILFAMQLYSFTEFNSAWLFAYKIRFGIVCGWRRLDGEPPKGERKKECAQITNNHNHFEFYVFFLLPFARSVLSEIRRTHPDYNGDRKEKPCVFLLDLQRTAVLNEMMWKRHWHQHWLKAQFDWSMEAISSHWLLFYVLDERYMMEILGERTTTSIKTTNWMCRTYSQLTTHGRYCNIFR